MPPTLRLYQTVHLYIAHCLSHGLLEVKYSFWMIFPAVSLLLKGVRHNTKKMYKIISKIFYFVFSAKRDIATFGTYLWRYIIKKLYKFHTEFTNLFISGYIFMYSSWKLNERIFSAYICLHYSNKIIQSVKIVI